MQSTASPARDHQVIFCGLEVLRLIGERMESRNEVDADDLRVVLGFMREVAHRYLENTEQLLQSALPAQTMVNHHRARSLFDEVSRAADASASVEFSAPCVAYATLLADLIFEERRFLPTVAFDGMILTQFAEREREIDEIARPHGQTLHRLEMKYTSPHCI